MAMDAAIVLDRHCDTQAVLPVYAGTPLAEATLPLAAYLGAQALLVCKVLGDDPFDESVSGTLFARGSRRRVSRQMRVAKIAGAVACRTGNFLRL